MKTAGVQLLDSSADEERGEIARMSAFVGAMAIADLVKTTLGPKGMDKILQSLSAADHITVTNDGATILKSIVLENPAAHLIVDLSQGQDVAVGDGTTSVAVLAGQL
jgi:T-complex protein 1 subunit beta